MKQIGLKIATLAALALAPSTAFAAEDAGLNISGVGSRHQARGVGAEAGLKLHFGSAREVRSDKRLQFELRGGPAFDSGSGANGRSQLRVRPVVALSFAPQHHMKLSIAGQSLAVKQIGPERAADGVAANRKIGVSSGGALAIGAGVTFLVLAALLADDVF